MQTMIYLIGGPPKVGKTSLAKELASKLNASWVSVDDLQNEVKKEFEGDELKEKFPSSFQRGKNNDEKYSIYSAQEVIDAYIKQAQASYDAMELLIKKEIKKGNNYIIEGYQVSPEFAYNMIKKYGSNEVKSIFLVRTNQELLLDDFEKSNTVDDWILERTEDKARVFPKIAKMISMYSGYIVSQTKKHNLPVVNMDKNFLQQLHKLVDNL